GHGEPHVRHLGEIRPLPAEEVLHVLVALVEVVDVLGHRMPPELVEVGNRQSTQRVAPMDARGEPPWSQPGRAPASTPASSFVFANPTVTRSGAGRRTIAGISPACTKSCIAV